MIRKSILTLMLLAFIGGVTAQNLQFEYEGHVYADGEEITCDNDEFGYGEVIQHMQIRNLSNDDLSVVIEKEVVEDLENTMNTFCFGNCYGPDVYVGSPVRVPAQSVSTEDLSFHVFFMEVEGEVVMRYYAYTEDDPNHKISLLVKFTYRPSSVSETVSMGHAYPNPASSVVRFNVQGVENASIAIFNLLGQEVLRQDVKAGQVTISVADLNKGIYFCNLMVDGEAVSTEKLIVK